MAELQVDAGVPMERLIEALGQPKVVKDWFGIVSDYSSTPLPHGNCAVEHLALRSTYK
jgi:hypothetical protein